MRRQTWSMLVVSMFLSTQIRADEKAPSEAEPIYQGKTVAEWIGDLKDTKYEMQRTAAESLGVFGPRKEVVSALTAALKINDAGVVLPAAQTLGKFGVKAKEALPELRAAYKRLNAGPPPLDEYSDEYLEMFAQGRQAVAEALILIDDHPGAELAPILLEGLKTNDADKRRDIVIKLGKLGPDSAKTTVPALISVLVDTNERVRAKVSSLANPPKINEIRLEAVNSLGRIGSAAKPALHALTLAMKIAAPERNTRVQQIEVSDKPAGSADAKIQTISFTLDNGDNVMLVACAEALGRIRPEAKGAVGALRLALRDLDEGVRWAALCALLESGQDIKEVVPILLNFVRDKDAATRRVAVETLGKSGTEAKQSVPALIEALKDAETQVRQFAAKSLGTIGAADETVITALSAALSDKEDVVVETAAEALSKFGARGKAAIPLLLPRLQNSDDVRRRGRYCFLLSKFGPPAKEAIPVLEKLSREDSVKEMRLVAHMTLAKIDSSRVKEAVRQIADALSSKEEAVLEAALECLANLGPDARGALPALRALRKRAQSRSLDDVIDAIENPKKDSEKR